MRNSDSEIMKKWIDAWEKAGASLQEIKRNELQSDDYYQKNLPLLNQMLQYAFDHRTVRLSSGLIELQQILMKWYSKKSEQEDNVQ